VVPDHGEGFLGKIALVLENVVEVLSELESEMPSTAVRME
jgi:hypothetical protein